MDKAQYGHKQITNIQTGMKTQQAKKIYLAIPYTWNPEKSFEIANKVAAKLMNEGHIVFSPISHSHKIADHLPNNLRTDSNWWMQQDLPLVEWCDELHVVVIGANGQELIDNSKGVREEFRKAAELRKQIKIIEYYD